MLAGSYYSVRTVRRGAGGHARRGRLKGELVRTDYPVIRVWEVDPHTQQYTREIDLPFLPGVVRLGAGQTPARRSPSTGWPSVVTLGLAGTTPVTEEVLTKPGDPFQFVVKEHLPASAPAQEHVADPDGTPMARIRVRFKPPGHAPGDGRVPVRGRPVVHDGEEVLPGRPRADARRPGADHVLGRGSARAGRGLPQAPGRRPARKGSPGSAIRTRPAAPASSTGRSTGSKGSRSSCRRATSTVTLTEVIAAPAPGIPPESRSWARTRSRSPSSRSGAVVASRPPTWRWRTCRWFLTVLPVARTARARPQAAARQRSITWSRRRSTPRPTAASARSMSWPVPDAFAVVPRLRPGQGRPGRAPLRRGGHQGEADRRLRRQSQHADDDQLRGRRLPPLGGRAGTSSCRSSSPRGRRTRGSAPAGSR